jgi:micrococcal nuclease
VDDRHKYWLLLLAIPIALSISITTSGQVMRSVSGQVVDVYDGDTITIADLDRTEWKVRLAAVDAPELGQAFGKKAKKQLLELLMGQPVTVKFDRTEGNDRIVGTVELESQRAALVSIFPININQYLVEQGFAWYDRTVQSSQSKEIRDLYSKLEAGARERRKGLWSDKNPVPPWEFRGKTANSDPPASPAIEVNENQKIIANKTSRLYYLSYCPDYDKVPALEQVSFKNVSDARAAGFKLAKSCEIK